MLLPIRAGDSNRKNYQAKVAGLIQQRGDAIGFDVGSIAWVELVAHARALYGVECIQDKLQNQFSPTKVSDFLARWEAICNLIPSPDATLYDRRVAFQQKLLTMNKMPTRRLLTDLLTAVIPDIFVSLITDVANDPNTISQFPGGSAIIGGPNATNGPWGSSICNISIELQQPVWMTDAQFFAETGKIKPVFDPLVPAFVNYDWFLAVSKDGYQNGLISVTQNSTSLVGINTTWLTPEPDGELNIEVGDVFECKDIFGKHIRLTVGTVNSNTSITLAKPAISTIFDAPYTVELFILDDENLDVSPLGV